MINMDELKPILETLLDGREDSASLIEQISSLDKPVEVDKSEYDKLNADWNERFKKAFFGEKADKIDESIPQLPEVPASQEQVEEEKYTYDNLFTEPKKED